MRQYIGARYVPKFMGTYDPTQVYEALCVVDNGLGTSYIAKVPTPANTPLTDTTYWAIYGASSGAIINLQQQIDDMNDGSVTGSLQNQIDTINTVDIPNITNLAKQPRKRKFVLIGDSFGVGVQGGSLPWGDGWIYYFDNKHDDVYYYDPQGDQQFPGTAGFSTNSGQNFIGQLNYVYTNKLGTTDPITITDVVVLGGTNDIGTAEINIINAIDSFCAQAKTLFPNAKISIGIWGLNGRAMVNGSDVYSAYKKGSLKNGCDFLDDAILLGCNPTYDSTYGHFNLAGYTLYAPYIEELILTGHTTYKYNFLYDLTLADADTPQYSFPYAILFYVTEHNIKIRIVDKSRYTSVILRTTSKLTDVNRLANVLAFPGNVGMYFPFDENTPLLGCECYYCNGTATYIPFGQGNVFIKNVNGSYYLQVVSPYPTFFMASIINDNTYDSYVSFYPMGIDSNIMASDI